MVYIHFVLFPCLLKPNDGNVWGINTKCNSLSKTFTVCIYKYTLHSYTKILKDFEPVLQIKLYGFRGLTYSTQVNMTLVPIL